VQVWARFEAEWAKASERHGVCTALLRMPPTETLPDRAAPIVDSGDSVDRSEVSLVYEVATRPPAARRAEFLRFRQRFIADQECEVRARPAFLAAALGRRSAMTYPAAMPKAVRAAVSRADRAQCMERQPTPLRRSTGSFPQDTASKKMRPWRR
jgi:hypothetical protein